ncbi:MAG: pilus assembly protein PilM [Candidatus Omnitrophica bacterium]|nr:pilus assembly protein PilM [Candidatus Omnitrophota bacterium]
MPKGVGVYVGRTEVVAVSAVRTVSGPAIKKYVVEPVNPTEPREPAVGKEAHKIKRLSPEAQAIHRALEKIQEPGAYVSVAVSPYQVVTRHFIMPAVPKKEESEAIRYEASRYIPFKFSESVLDYCLQTTHKNVFSVTATAIRQEILDTCLADLRSAGAKVLMVEPVFSSISRTFSVLNMIGRSKAYAFVVIQNDGNVNVTFAAKGIVYLSRDFLLTGKIEEDKTRFFEELKASIDYFYKLTGGEDVSQVFLTGHGDLKFWVEYLEHSLNYSIRFDVAVSPSEKAVPSDVFSTVIIAYGLALRSLGYRSPLGEMKLLPPVERKSKPENLIGFLIGECLAALVIFLLLQLAVFQPTVQKLKQQDEAILAPLIAKDPSILSRTPSDLKAEKDVSDAHIAQLDGFFQAKVPVNVLLETLGKGLPRSVTVDAITYEETPDASQTEGAGVKRRLDINGMCYLGSSEKEAGEISAWATGLSSYKEFAEYFDEFKLEETKREKFMNVGVTRFKVLCE